MQAEPTPDLPPDSSDNGLDDLLSRGCNLLASHFRANPSQREDLGICLDQPL